MKPSAVAISVIFFIVFVGSVVGFRAGNGRKMNLEE